MRQTITVFAQRDNTSRRRPSLLNAKPVVAWGLWACGLWATVWCVITTAPPVQAAGPVAAAPVVHYRITCRANDPSPHWEFAVHVAGLSPASRDVQMRLDNWGEWSRLDSYYLTIVESRPPAGREWNDPGLIRFDFPERDWGGTIDLTYRIAVTELGSNAQRSGRLTPFRAANYSAGFVQNTLMRVQVGDKPLEAERTVELIAPEGWKVVTGWAGLSEGRQTATLARDDENGLVAFGTPSAVAIANAQDGVRCEVVQFGDSPDATAATLKIVSALAPLYGRNLGKRIDRPVRVILVQAHNGGTHTHHGLLVDSPDTPDDIASPEYVQLVAHELFHLWLGGYLEPPDESLVWLHEGFTDYLAAWHAASAGLVTPQWFADRLVTWDTRAQASGVLGKVTFADPKVRWRDGGNETLAYNGGALLAFAIDVALRQSGVVGGAGGGGGPGASAGLRQLIGEMLADEHATKTPAGNIVLTFDAFRASLEQHGLGELYRQHIEQPGAIDVGALAASIGCAVEDTDVPLTYLGIRADRDRPVANVIEVEPESPAARAGIRAGDRIFGYSPTRRQRPRVADHVQTRFRFGLTILEPSAAPLSPPSGAYLDVMRDGNELEVPIEPALIPGGRIVRYRVDEAKIRPFLQCAGQ